jgi:hypothetical protein
MSPQADEQQLSLTREQVMAKYGDVLLKFTSYYKYAFTYVGETTDGLTICCVIGGDAGDIYRFSVKADSTTSLNEDQWGWASVNRGPDSLWDEDRR